MRQTSSASAIPEAEIVSVEVEMVILGKPPLPTLPRLAMSAIWFTKKGRNELRRTPYAHPHPAHAFPESIKKTLPHPSPGNPSPIPPTLTLHPSSRQPFHLGSRFSNPDPPCFKQPENLWETEHREANPLQANPDPHPF